MPHCSRHRSIVSASSGLVLLIILVGIAIISMNSEHVTGILTDGVPILGMASILAIGCTTLFLWYRRRQDQARLRAVTISDVDHMTGVDFERYVGKLLRSQGYQVRFTPTSSDYGIDILARNEHGTYGVQVKRYAGLVGRAAVSDAVAGQAHYHCTKAMVVTNSYFTPNAKVLARANSCALVDRETLSNWILAFSSAPESCVSMVLGKSR